ncbi:MAG: ArsA family ATPase [Candidatus Desantisbacteria bacterium]
MGLTGLEENRLKLILFGGKGGVGKTTCASSTGIRLSKDFKTLIFSTDPAHSLADSLGENIGDEVKEVNSIKNLSVLQISAEKAFSKFKIDYESQIKKILDTSTYLDEQDIEAVFDLPIPGIDEVMGFKTIVDLIDEAKFDKYIVDTAPTGHALRLLTLPELLDDWIKVMAKMRWKYRYMVTSFGGKYKPDEGDDFLLEMKKTVKRIECLLRDSQRCEFVAVTIPEDMAILETERLINTLSRYGIKVRQLVVNNVLESGDCKFCTERREGQRRYVNLIREKFSSLKVTIVPLQAQEVKGLDGLNNFKDLLFRAD